MIIKKCLTCGKEFSVWPYEIRNNKGKYCSKKCYGLSKKGKPSQNKGKKMPQISGKNNYNWKGGLAKRKCLICGKEFTSPRYRIRKGYGKFCSRKCFEISERGQIPWNKDKKVLQISGKNHWNWQGGKTIKNSGYILILKSNHPNATKHGYVPEHRLVMEKKISRYLTAEEIVHHINLIKTDNRPENLWLFKNNIEHIVYHSNVLITYKKWGIKKFYSCS